MGSQEHLFLNLLYLSSTVILNFICTNAPRGCKMLPPWLYASKSEFVNSNVLFRVQTGTLHLWGSAYNTHLNPLIVGQKKAIRIIAKVCPREHTTPLFNRLEILPLNELYNFAIGSFMYKQINHLSPKIIDNIKFSSEVHNYNTSSWIQHQASE